jgi:hypothetical protein
MIPESEAAKSGGRFWIRITAYVTLALLICLIFHGNRSNPVQWPLSSMIGVGNGGHGKSARSTHHLANVTDSGSGVVIIPRIEDTMFPSSWADSDAPTSASEPNAEKVPAAIKGIEKALRKYPNVLLKQNLIKIYVVDNLMVDGVPSGGVNCPERKTLYVDLDNLEPNEIVAWAEETVHHEFAHLLADNHPALFSSDSWARLNNPGFRYGNGGTDAIRHGHDGDRISEDFLSSGFVEEYSKSDADEDFATLSERLLSGDRNVLRAADHYPVLHRKEIAVFKFYHSLSDSLTETYIRKLPSSTTP